MWDRGFYSWKSGISRDLHGLTFSGEFSTMGTRTFYLYPAKLGGVLPVINLIDKITVNVLTAFYQPFWFSLLLAVMFMFLYLYSGNSAAEGGKGWAEALKTWFRCFRKDPAFRRLFFLAFYVTLILFRTLLNRDLWMNPLSDVMGGWGLYKENTSTGEMELTTESVENFLLFLPFSVLLFWNFREKLLGARVKVGKTFLKALGIVFLCSLSIEFLQLFLRLGTFQFSDLCYNTLGGGAGGLVYYLGHRIFGKEKES